MLAFYLDNEMFDISLSFLKLIVTIMRILQIFLVSILALLLSSCATCLDCGKLVLDHNVSQLFESLTVNPDYRYYYSGHDVEPDAIMGLDKELTLTGGYWEEVNLTEDQLKLWIQAIRSTGGMYGGGYQGHEIQAADGTVSGVYYSRLEWLIIKYPGGNTIYVSEPEHVPWKSDSNVNNSGMGSLIKF